MRNKFLITLIIISVILGAGTLRRGHEWGDDFAWYILQAKSILTGTTAEFMQQSAFINTQSTTHVGPLAYPWGYPLILVPVYALKGLSPLPLKLPGLFLYASFLFCLYFLMKTRFTRTESLLVVALFAFNPMLIRFEDQILSDIPFLFFSTLALLLMIQDNKRGVFQYILIGASIFLTAFIRATGILLLGSFLAVEFLDIWKNIRDRTAVKKIMVNSLIVCFVFAALWIANALLFPNGGESYLSQYAGLTLERVKNFAVSYFNIFALFFGEAVVWKYLYYALFIFFLVGVWVRRKDETIFIIFAVLWMIVHVTYPYWQGARYIFPLLPIFIFFTFWGMKTVIAGLSEKNKSVGQIIFNGFWLVIIAIFFITSSINAYKNIQNNRAMNGPYDPFSTEMFAFIKEQTPPDSVIEFFKPRAMRLFTGRNSIMILECSGLPTGDYEVIHKNWENSQIPPGQVDECGVPLKPVYENRRFLVYRILK